MSLVLGIVGRHVDRIIGKLSNPLETGCAESAYSCRIHIGIKNISGIKFINHTSLLIETFQIGERNIVAVYGRQEVSLAGMSGYKTNRIPLIGSTLYGCRIVSLYHMLVMTDIVKHRFAVACTLQGGQHLIYIITRLSNSAGMARLVVYFKAYDIRIVFVSITCIRIHVAYKGSNILFLRNNCFSIAMNGTFIIMR